MKNTQKHFIFTFYFLCSFSLISQNTPIKHIETEAIITDINFTISSRRSAATATVKYMISKGDSLSSTVKLFHIPFIGSLHNVGDKVQILYNQETPLIITTKSTSFWQTYGIYILIALGVLILIFRLKKVKKVK